MHRLTMRFPIDIGAHVFPTRKYRLVRNRLLDEGTVTENQIRKPEPVTDEDVALVHTPEYVDKINNDTLSVPEQRWLRNSSSCCGLTSDCCCRGRHHARALRPQDMELTE